MSNSLTEVGEIFILYNITTMALQYKNVINIFYYPFSYPSFPLVLYILKALNNAFHDNFILNQGFRYRSNEYQSLIHKIINPYTRIESKEESKVAGFFIIS